MHAAEVLRRYAAGERDFRRTNLRGQSFQGKDLSGADFSEADIRGTNFSNAMLQGANFAGAQAGIQKRWAITHLVIALVISFLSGILSGFAGAFAKLFFDLETTQNPTSIPEIVILGMLSIVFVAIIRQGYTVAAFGTIAVAVVVAVVVAGAGAVVVAVVVAGAGAGAVTGAVAVAVAVAVAGIVTVVVAGALAVAVAVADADADADAVAVAVAGAGIVAGTVAGADIVASTVAGRRIGIVTEYISGAFSFTTTKNIIVTRTVTEVVAEVVSVVVAVTGAVAVTVAGVATVLSVYVAWRALKEDEKFALIRSIAVAFGAIGGTYFHKADLTGANFTKATLKRSNFRAATLTHVCWSHAQKLDRARMGESSLSTAAVRELLVTGNGYQQSYIDANLRGANLNGVNLNEANLKWADLSDATLRRADLRGANLTATLAIGTDFTRAHLTGACLEAWNIDHTIVLDGVDCQYVFLLEQPNALGSRERRPHDPEQAFQAGDFERLYQKMINVVQLLLRNGVNREAFAAAFHQLMEEHPDISYDSIQAIEKKGNDVLVTLEVPATLDKATIARDFLKPYEARLKYLEAENEQLKLRTTDLKAIALALAQHPVQITNQAVGDGNAVNEKINHSQNIQVGGNFNIEANNAVVNLRDISGTVTNTIQQLPNSPGAGPSLKDLLIELQAVLEQADPAVLPPADKADALEQVKGLAEAAQKPEAEKKALGAKAMRFLRRVVDAVPTAIPLATTLVS